ncbi:uncharacterized protein KY384_003055 [Bacidia gigantensis]|uniref:uncharacterized protein n=1 Tax=Bacidia gigantensis TaxID=2732470 RepID=UPI001D03F261|nr:uncharacterized protein KY384_003055 [Bacidia gigantensis]KAG8531426.1 hypothetical protein KY384_003055 [Bacidia gigantensis]
MAGHHGIRIPHGVISEREGEHWMDSPRILVSQLPRYTKPWDDCIEAHQLSKDNLPPFYVRLRDDQVGHLYWGAGGLLKPHELNQYWPFDFNTSGSYYKSRESWGPPYDDPETNSMWHLRGNSLVPEYLDPGLPLTCISSHKVMWKELEKLRTHTESVERRHTETIKGLKDKASSEEAHYKLKISRHKKKADEGQVRIQELNIQVEQVEAKNVELRNQYEEAQHLVSEALDRIKKLEGEVANEKQLRKEEVDDIQKKYAMVRERLQATQEKVSSLECKKRKAEEDVAGDLKGIPSFRSVRPKYPGSQASSLFPRTKREL